MATKSGQQEPEKAEVIEELLDALDSALDRVKVLYEQYFLGIQKQPPTYLHTDVERKIRDITQIQVRNTALRYRFSTITQKFGSYNAYWRRTLRQIENGTYTRNLVKVSRQAARTGAEIPEEILAAMPKRMRDQVKRDREAALAVAAMREQHAAAAAPVDDDLLTLADDDVDMGELGAAMISEPAGVRRDVRAANGALQIDETDGDFDLDAFFSKVVDETAPDPAPEQAPVRWGASDRPVRSAPTGLAGVAARGAHPRPASGPTPPPASMAGEPRPAAPPSGSAVPSMTQALPRPGGPVPTQAVPRLDVPLPASQPVPRPGVPLPATTRQAVPRPGMPVPTQGLPRPGAPAPTQALPVTPRMPVMPGMRPSLGTTQAIPMPRLRGDGDESVTRPMPRAEGMPVHDDGPPSVRLHAGVQKSPTQTPFAGVPQVTRPPAAIIPPSVAAAAATRPGMIARPSARRAPNDTSPSSGVPTVAMPPLPGPSRPPPPPPKGSTLAPSQATRPSPIAPGSSSTMPALAVETLAGPFPRIPSPAAAHDEPRERPTVAVNPLPRQGTAPGAGPASPVAPASPTLPPARPPAVPPRPPAVRAPIVPGPGERPPPSQAAPPRVTLPAGVSDADVNALYTKYVQAKQTLGEQAGPNSYDKLLKTIHAQAPKIMEQYKAKGVDFSVVVKDNQVVIRAKPKP